MFFGILTLITALTISAVAIYYSVAGLAAIFAAAVIPIVIMGTTLEVAKLVTAVWLHRYWHQATWWLKTYLSVAVVVLMFITSMGIFGFLSKAHIEQTAQAEGNTARVERIDEEIARQRAVIERADDKIETVQDQGVGADRNIQEQIDREQARIDQAYARIQPAIEEQQTIIDAQVSIYQDQITQIDGDLAKLNQFIADDEIAKAQGLIGAEADGVFGPNTAEAVRQFREQKAAERQELVAQLQSVEQKPTVQRARAEIERLRQSADQQVAQSNQLIDRLRSQLGQNTGEDIDTVLAEENATISQANARIDELTEEKFTLEAQYRALEAEVGPIKYIAEFIYGDSADKALLEEAVRWVIIIIIFVFDPLAVLLLIASQYTFRWHGRELFEMESLAPASADTETVDRSTAFAREKTFNTETDEEEIFGSSLTRRSPNSNANTNRYQFDDSPVQENTTKFSIVTPGDVDDEIDSDDPQKEAKRLWKKLNPDDTIKHQETLHRRGLIDQLPWEAHLTLSDHEPAAGKTDFGTAFPNNPSKGDVFVRVDYLPTKLFKHNGTSWIELDKNLSDTFVYNENYIDHLIDKISTGEYDPELLNESEKLQIEERLQGPSDPE